MITSGVTVDIAVPNEEGEVITIRMLSHGALKQARNARMKELASLVSGLDLDQFKREDADADEIEKVERDPLTGFDMLIVLRKGIKAWTYDVPCNNDNKDELDEATAEYVGREIIKLSRRDTNEGEASSETSPAGS